MIRSRFFLSLAILVCASLISGHVHAIGAWQIYQQYSFPNPEGVTIVAPFIDANGDPWVLGNDPENVQCVLIGPFNQNDPPSITWQIEDEGGFPDRTQCISVEPGPEGNFLIRGYRPPTPYTEETLRGFIASLLPDYEIEWIRWDDEYLEAGSYGQPLAPVAWSDSGGGILTFFLGVVTVGVDSVNILHGLSLADETGLLRRVISDWGNVSSGALQAVRVMPDGDYLVVAHASGTEFLAYDGRESIDYFIPGGIAWEDESVLYVQFQEESLYIAHYPRLDLTGIPTTLTRVSDDGDEQYYSRDLARIIEIPLEGEDEPLEVELPRPLLSYVTVSTSTFVRFAEITYVLQVIDNESGNELAIQPLETIDPNVPTHMGDARSADKLILMTGAVDPATGGIIRYVDIIEWNPEAETPGGIPSETDEIDNAEQADGTDADMGNDVDAAETSETGPGEEPGCCQVAPSPLHPLLGLFCVLFVGLCLVRRRGAEVIHW